MVGQAACVLQHYTVDMDFDSTDVADTEGTEFADSYKDAEDAGAVAARH